MHVVVRVQQDEGQEGLEEGGLGDGAQEQVQVRRGGHHLLHRQLNTHRITLFHTLLGSDLQTFQFSLNLNIRCERFLGARDVFRYLVQSRSQNRHQEALVDVTEQLRPDGGMSDLRETDKDGTDRVINASLLYCLCHCSQPVCVCYLGNSTTEVQ